MNLQFWLVSGKDLVNYEALSPFVSHFDARLFSHCQTSAPGGRVRHKVWCAPHLRHVGTSAANPQANKAAVVSKGIPLQGASNLQCPLLCFPFEGDAVINNIYIYIDKDILKAQKLFFQSWLRFNPDFESSIIVLFRSIVEFLSSFNNYWFFSTWDWKNKNIQKNIKTQTVWGESEDNAIIMLLLPLPLLLMMMMMTMMMMTMMMMMMMMMMSKMVILRKWGAGGMMLRMMRLRMMMLRMLMVRVVMLRRMRMNRMMLRRMRFRIMMLRMLMVRRRMLRRMMMRIR